MTREKKIQEKYTTGVSVSNIAREEGISREMVYKYLRRIPEWKDKLIQMRTFRYYRRLDEKYFSFKQKAVDMREKGFSASKVCKELNIPFPVTVEILRGTTFDNSKTARRDRNKKIYKAYKAGKSQTYLSKEFGLSQSWISTIIEQWENLQKTSK